MSKAKVFFDHLVLHEDLTADLNLHKLEPEEKEELLQVVDEIMHHHILDIILKHLPKEHHTEFVSRLSANPSDPSHIGYLKERVSVDIEKEISDHASKVKQELKKEISKAKK